jgi:hypothetical protein
VSRARILTHVDAPLHNEQPTTNLTKKGFMVEECGEVACQASQLDREMSGGVASEGDGDGGGGAVVPITFMALRRALGGDTVGVKFGG